MKTVCMVCKELQSGDADDPIVSHGICKKCEDDMIAQELLGLVQEVKKCLGRQGTDPVQYILKQLNKN